jgi:hypothetical protein
LSAGGARGQTGVNFTLYLDNESLTLYVPAQSGGSSVSLLDFAFETALSNEQRVTYRLDRFAVFQALRFNAVPTPICFQVRLSGSTPTLPLDCDGVTTLVHPLAAADVFWYDAGANARRTLLILGGSTNAICPAGQVQCDLVYQPPIPTPTPTWTPSPTATSTPTITPTPIFTPTFTPTPTLDASSGLVAVTRNADWTPIIRDFDGVPMALVPVGCFMMGSNVNPDEQPIHEVCFDAPYWIDVTEVTQAQFAAFGGQKANANAFTGDERPVERITWFEAYDYCVNKRGMRLPTEAEWEYAARRVESWVYPWGNEFIGDNVVYGGNSNSQTAVVGSRPSGVSWVGAMDMSGNVWEWVNTIYNQARFPYPYREDDGRENVQDINEPRVLRGGSWFITNTVYLRAPVRKGNAPDNRSNSFGFRCSSS